MSRVGPSGAGGDGQGAAPVLPPVKVRKAPEEAAPAPEKRRGGGSGRSARRREKDTRAARGRKPGAWIQGRAVPSARDDDAATAIQAAARGCFARQRVQCKRRPLMVYVCTQKGQPPISWSQRAGLMGMPDVDELTELARTTMGVAPSEPVALHSRCLRVDFALVRDADVVRMWRLASALPPADRCVCVELVVLSSPALRALVRAGARSRQQQLTAGGDLGGGDDDGRPSRNAVAAALGALATPGLANGGAAETAVALQVFEHLLHERKVDTRKWTGLSGVQTAEDLWVERSAKLVDLSVSTSSVTRCVTLVRVRVLAPGGEQVLLRSPYARARRRRSSAVEAVAAARKQPTTTSGRWKDPPPATDVLLLDAFHPEDNLVRAWLRVGDSPFRTAMEALRRALFPRDRRSVDAFVKDLVRPLDFDEPVTVVVPSTPQYPGLATHYRVLTLNALVDGLDSQPFRTTDNSQLATSISEMDCVSNLIQWHWAPRAEAVDIRNVQTRVEARQQPTGVRMASWLRRAKSFVAPLGGGIVDDAADGGDRILSARAGRRKAKAKKGRGPGGKVRGGSVLHREQSLREMQLVGGEHPHEAALAAGAHVGRTRQVAELPRGPLTEQLMQQWMEHNDIDAAKYGEGPARSVRDLMNEVLGGVCSIVAVATSTGDYVPQRQVSVSKLLVRHPQHPEKMLVETHRLIDGTRMSLTYSQPSAKAPPHMSGYDAALQCVRDELVVPLRGGKLAASKQVRRPTVKLSAKELGDMVEEAKEHRRKSAAVGHAIALRDVSVPTVEVVESRSFPDLVTRYVLRNFEVEVDGLPQSAFQTQRGNLVSFWDWLTEAERARASQLLNRVQLFLRITDDKAQERHRVAGVEAFLLEAAVTNDVEALRLLLELWEGGELAREYNINLSSVSDPFHVTDKHGNTALRRAALKGVECRDTAALLLRRSLLRFEHMVLRQDEFGCTPLYYAALIGDLSLVDAMLRLNADPSSVCLLCVATNGCTDVLRLLLQRMRHSVSPDALRDPVLPCEHPRPAREHAFYAQLLAHTRALAPAPALSLSGAGDSGPGHTLRSTGIVLQQTDPTRGFVRAALPEFLVRLVADDSVVVGRERLVHFVRDSVYPVHMLVAVVHALGRAAKLRPSHSVLLEQHADGLTTLIEELLNSCNDRDTALGLMQERTTGGSARTSPFHMVAAYGMRSIVAHQVYQAEHEKVWFGAAAAVLEGRSVLARMGVCLALLLVQIAFLPLVLLLPLVPRLRRHLALDTSEWSSPYVKFFAHSASYVCWVAVLAQHVIEDASLGRHDSHTVTNVERALFVFMAGHVVGLAQQLHAMGRGKFWAIMANRTDTAIVSLLFVAYTDQALFDGDIYNEVMAITSIVMVGRLLFLFASHRTIGPLAIALVSMTIDFAYFAILLIIAIGAFALGIAFLGKDDVPEHFRTLRSSGEALVWTFFSPFELVDPVGDHSILFDGVFFAFLVTVTTVLGRLLIAMLVTSYSRVQGESARQWQFTMSTLSIHYQSMPIVPAPLNIAVAAAAVLGRLLRLSRAHPLEFLVVSRRLERESSRNLEYRQMRVAATTRFFAER